MISITWLHLSDFHFNTEKNQDQDRVLNALIRDVGKVASPKGVKLSEKNKFIFRPDFIFVSGDIAHSGEKEQYKKAEKFFVEIWQKTGLGEGKGPFRTFTVPGNHDLVRKRPKESDIAGYVVSEYEYLMNKKTPKSFHEALYEIWSTKKRRIDLFHKFNEYAEFVRFFLKSNHPNFGWEKPSFLKFIPFGKNGNIDEVGVEVAGLCTPWIGGRDDEDGTLVIGSYQIDDIELPQAKPTLFRVAILHHPFRALHDFDVDNSRKRLLKNFDFLLFGHLHREYFHQEITPEYSTFHFYSGASFEHPFLVNSYSIVQVTINNKNEIDGMTICRRIYRRDGNDFVGDNSQYSSLGEGIVKIPKECINVHNKVSKKGRKK